MMISFVSLLSLSFITQVGPQRKRWWLIVRVRCVSYGVPEKATNEDLLSEDWETNLLICDKVQEEGENG